ncbi:hypothetical protein ISCGN_007822 [Ixodes scapularis]
MGHRKPRNTLKKLMLSTGATVKDLIGEIRDTFYPDETQTMAQQIPTAETRLDREVQTAQQSEEIKGIDSDFTDAELQTALFQLKRNTAPGPEKITYGMLRNIPDNKLDELQRHINEVWATGELPEEWKEAHVIMLPKPGKLPNTPANLRPISKTSCMGKLMEKMALNRLEWHLEATNELAHSLVGFRKHVSTQDVAKMIKEQVYDNPSTVQQRTIVAVDLKRAFDNVMLEAILRNLRETNPGNRMYRYVKNFLKDRTFRACVLLALASCAVADYAWGGLGYGHGLGYSGLGYTGLGYTGLGYGHGLNYGHGISYGHGLGYGHSGLTSYAVGAPASYSLATPAVRRAVVAPYQVAPTVAHYQAAPVVASYAAAPVVNYSPTPVVSKVAAYQVAPAVQTVAHAPAVATYAHAAPSVATYAHAAPAVASYAHAAPAVASYAHAAPVYGYGVGSLGYGVGHYGYGQGLGSYGLNYGYGLGTYGDYYNTLLRKKCKFI